MSSRSRASSTGPCQSAPSSSLNRSAAVELAGLLHPTPAVGGEPFAAAAPLIPALEGLDRGLRTPGPVGSTDANEDGEAPCRRAALRAPSRVVRRRGC